MPTTAQSEQMKSIITVIKIEKDFNLKDSQHGEVVLAAKTAMCSVNLIVAGEKMV